MSAEQDHPEKYGECFDFIFETCPSFEEPSVVLFLPKFSSFFGRLKQGLKYSVMLMTSIFFKLEPCTNGYGGRANIK